MRFGKHKDTILAEIQEYDPNYIAWLEDKMSLPINQTWLQRWKNTVL
jgi:hypothetical protein